MNQPLQTNNSAGGLIGWFARNKVACNLLMALLLVGGVLSISQVRREVFPDIDTRTITVRVEYPAASPEEVEEAICLRIEEAIAGIDGIERLRSVAVEHQGTVIAELAVGASAQAVLSDIDSAVSAIHTLPPDAEKPIVAEMSDRIRVLGVVVHGDVEQRVLRELAQQVEDDLTATPGVSQVEMAGVRPYEIAIEIDEQTLRQYGLTLETVADRVARHSLDLPGGTVRTEDGQLRIRTRGQKYHGREYEAVPLLTRANGTVLRLGEVATIRDDFAETDVAQYFDGGPAVMLRVFRVGQQDAIDLASAVKQYVAQKQEAMPAGVTLTTWFDRADYLLDRINLLARNAIAGIILVWLCLSLLLAPRLAFWITVGIGTSFLGAFWMLPLLGVSINMMSLFGFIVVLGLVVDDAIVIGEAIHARRQAGEGAIEAAVNGARELAVPVTLTVLTTIIAFGPLLFTEGEVGRVIRDIPLVVAAVLALSLAEALLILPAHLATRHLFADATPFARVRGGIQRGLDAFIAGPYRRLAGVAGRGRYATLGIATGVFLLALGVVASGYVKFVYIDDIEADAVVAHVRMPHGTTAEHARAVTDRIEEAADRVRRELEADRSADAVSLVRHTSTTIGEQPYRQLQGVPGYQQGGGGAGSGGGAHLAEVVVELLPGDERWVTAAEVVRRWREEVGQLPGVENITFESKLFSAGKAVHVDLAHRDYQQTLAAAQQLQAQLREFAGVSGVESSHTLDKPELVLTLKDHGQALGVSLDQLSRQVRGAFYGVEAERVQRGPDELKVMVRYPREQRARLSELSDMRIRLGDGVEVPLGEVAAVEQVRGPAQINRADRRRIISVTAEVDSEQASATQINGALAGRILPELQQQFPGLSYTFAGQQAEQAKSMASLGGAFVIALLAIYLLLGARFRSYAQPLIVLAAMPLGFIGAVAGHWLMGLNLSFLSLFGLVALTGVVVNDALILIDYVNRHRGEGSLEQLVVEAGQRRFRPILLTTLTTFLGLTPMLMETSLQAQFLVPMAASLAFGIIVASAVTLLIVPALYLVLEDVKRFAAAEDAAAGGSEAGLSEPVSTTTG